MSEMDDKGKISCVALMSGGLDSILAAAVVKRQGIEVLGIFVNTGFCLADHRRRHPRPEQEPPRNEALRAGADLGVQIEIIDISEEYIKILLNPRHGYGSAANPCIDCKIEMFRRAKNYMEEIGARFIISGEVAGQRPMTQKEFQLKMIAKESGCEDILLRPLSAKILKPTLPEREGWVNRDELHGFAGRGRSPQIALAKELGIADYPQPAGGCFLTDKNFANRLFDLYEHRGKDAITREDLELLKAGRHFRLGEVKVIVGRNEGENNYLEGFAAGRIVMQAADHLGPITIIEGTPDTEQLTIGARITARYGKGRNERLVRVRYKPGGRTRGLNPLSEDEIIEVSPEPGDLERWRI